ncbi:MAG: hypothetical protein ACLS5Z_05855 [Clostridium fessum]
MFSKKKTECRVCGYRFTPERENIYTAEEPRSMADMLTKAPTRFSAVDCPVCGCQIRLADRAPRIDLPAITEQHDADALNIPASPYPDGDKAFWLARIAEAVNICTTQTKTKTLFAGNADRLSSGVRR